MRPDSFSPHREQATWEGNANHCFQMPVNLHGERATWVLEEACPHREQGHPHRKKVDGEGEPPSWDGEQPNGVGERPSPHREQGCCDGLVAVGSVRDEPGMGAASHRCFEALLLSNSGLGHLEGRFGVAAAAASAVNLVDCASAKPAPSAKAVDRVAVFLVDENGLGAADRTAPRRCVRGAVS